MKKDKTDFDGWLTFIVGVSCVVAGSIFGYFAIPEVVKLLYPKPPEPKGNPNPIPQPQPEKEPPKRLRPIYMVESPPDSQRLVRIQPKYLHSSAKRGEENRQISKFPQQSYRFQMSGQKNVEKPRTRWRVIE